MRPSALLEEFTKEVNSMTADFDSSNGNIPVHAAPVRSGMSRWAVGLAAAVAVLVLVFGVAFAIAYASKGTAGFTDNWLGSLGAVALYFELFVSLVAFSMAITVKIRHEKWAWIWLPLIAFPGLLVLIVLSDLLWWQ